MAEVYFRSRPPTVSQQFDLGDRAAIIGEEQGNFRLSLLQPIQLAANRPP